MASFFSGWIGYGTGFTAGALLEPADPAYARRPITFSRLESEVSFDIGGGTVGPASVPWGVLTYAGLYDALSAGNLLVVFPLFRPATIGAGVTYTTGPGSNMLVGTGLSSHRGSLAIPAGALMGQTPDGRPWTTSVAVQVSNGVLAAQVVAFGNSVTMASLPAQSPNSGSGQLWNDGGVIAVA